MKEGEYLDITVIPHEDLSDEELNELVDHIVDWFEKRDLHIAISLALRKNLCAMAT